MVEPSRYPVTVFPDREAELVEREARSPGTPDPALMVEAVRALARASRVLEGASDELNLAHYRVLSAIASGDERASRVAARLALGKPAVSAAVEALSRRGLLTRTVVERDQRAAALCVTRAGRETLERVETAMVGRINAVCGETSDGQQLVRSLIWMGGAIDGWRAKRRAGGE